MKFILAGLLLLSAATKAAVIEYRRSGHLHEVIEEALALLPSSYLDRVGERVSIEAIPFKSDVLFQNEDLCQINEGVKFGLTKRAKITISSRLVELSEKNLTQFPCGHRSFRNMLKAVIIHELTHVKDNAEKISADANFQRIVGVKKVTSNTKKKLMNQNASSSPDAYEFVNLEESLAVNLEYLTLDPEFECRKPATANFLSKRLGVPLKGLCEKNHKLLVQSAYLEDNYQLSVLIDPKRVYQVHYLFAGKGRQLMSRWGHAMFRLVICAPYRKTMGPDCLDDVSHHVALSYRASMSDLNVSYMKGMFGAYPSQLFVLRYLEVQQEYTKNEFRDLFSIPIKLNAEQKQEFLDLTLERFWTYQGRYYFIDNNCGTEAAKHLSVALPPEEADLIRSITPLQIYNDIVAHGHDLADENVNGLSREEMIKKKFLSESMFKSINETYQFLRPHLPSFRYDSLEKFLKKTRADQRLLDYESFMTDSEEMDPVVRKQVVLKMIHFERYIAGRLFSGVLRKVLQRMDRDSDLKNMIQVMGETLRLQALQPWEIIPSRYGVPTRAEFEGKYPLFLVKRRSELTLSMEEQLTSLQKILKKSYFAEDLLEIEGVKKLKKMTGDFINNLSSIPLPKTKSQGDD